jgi:TatD DNase family protein
MLIETDSPYLSPDPLRGKSNEPANVKIVAENIALIKEISFEEVANLTTSNFKNFFFNDQQN